MRLAIGAEAETAIPEASVFMEQAAQNGQVEIEAAKAALARSQDPGIRSFAQRMVQDHAAANLELTQLARAKGIDLPSRLDAQHQATLDQITSKSGAEFDRDYSEHINMGHARALALFEAATNSPDPQVSGFAKKTLPTLREHEKLARKLPGAMVRGDIPGGF